MKTRKCAPLILGMKIRRVPSVVSHHPEPAHVRKFQNQTLECVEWMSRSFCLTLRDKHCPGHMTSFSRNHPLVEKPESVIGGVCAISILRGGQSVSGVPGS